MSKVKTVGSISISRGSKGLVNITIEDEHSGDKVLELSLTLEAYGLLVTGLSCIKGQMEVNSDAAIAKQREVKTIITDSIPKFGNKEDKATLVEKHFNNSGLAEDGWILHSNGTTTQQNSKQGYAYTIKRYVPVEDATKIDRLYY
jgi:hypothetical protein